MNLSVAEEPVPCWTRSRQPLPFVRGGKLNLMYLKVLPWLVAHIMSLYARLSLVITDSASCFDDSQLSINTGTTHFPTYTFNEAVFFQQSWSQTLWVTGGICLGLIEFSSKHPILESIVWNLFLRTNIWYFPTWLVLVIITYTYKVVYTVSSSIQKTKKQLPIS